MGRRPVSRDDGFTLTELIMVIVILGVLSVFALPKWFNATTFDQRGYFDRLLQAARYAQKLAVASNCEVQLIIDAGSFTLRQPTTTAQCGNGPTLWQAVSLPSERPPPYNAPSGVQVTAGIGTTTFSAAGSATPGGQVIVNGTLTFSVHSATGYVERL
jgi:MSHA pilin protein MshC